MQSTPPDIAAGKAGVGLSGDAGGRLAALLDPTRSATCPAPLLQEQALGDTFVLVLQNLNASLGAVNPVVTLLRRFVEGGGGLFLAHDTGYSMASPFPEFVRGPLIPPEKGESRHILDLDIHLEPVQALLGDLAGATYRTSFNDHLVFELGPEATAVARDRYGHPTIVTGEVAGGRVVFSGCWYGRMDDTNSVEAEVTGSLLEWLVEAAAPKP